MKKTIDDVYKMCESRYALVALVANKAREIAQNAEDMGEKLEEKPVNIVLGNLLSGKSVIVTPSAALTSRISIDFDAASFGEDDEADEQAEQELFEASEDEDESDIQENSQE